jgi:hypothetical protein
MRGKKPKVEIQTGNIVQVNLNGPPQWFGCLLVVEKVIKNDYHCHMKFPGNRKNRIIILKDQCDIVGMVTFY